MKTLLATLLLLLVGCYTQTYLAPTIDKPAMLSGAASVKNEYTVVKRFSIQDRSGWFIAGLIPSGHTNVNDLLKNEVVASGGDAVINLKITSQYDVVDILISALTGGIYNTRATHLEGEVIKYKENKQ